MATQSGCHLWRSHSPAESATTCFPALVFNHKMDRYLTQTQEDFQPRFPAEISCDQEACIISKRRLFASWPKTAKNNGSKQPPSLRKDTVSRNQFSLQNRTDSWIASEYSEIFRWLGRGGAGGGGDGPARLRHLTIIYIIYIIYIFIIIIIIIIL